MAVTLMQNILTEVRVRPGLSATEIARRLSASPPTVITSLRRLQETGVVDRVSGGGPRNGDTWYPSPQPLCCECSRPTPEPWPDHQCARCGKPLCTTDVCRRRHADGC